MCHLGAISPKWPEYPGRVKTWRVSKGWVKMSSLGRYRDANLLFPANFQRTELFKKNGFEVEILLVVKADKLSKDKGVSKVQFAHGLHLGSKFFVFLLT